MPHVALAAGLEVDGLGETLHGRLAGDALRERAVGPPVVAAVAGDAVGGVGSLTLPLPGQQHLERRLDCNAVGGVGGHHRGEGCGGDGAGGGALRGGLGRIVRVGGGGHGADEGDAGELAGVGLGEQAGQVDDAAALAGVGHGDGGEAAVALVARRFAGGVGEGGDRRVARGDVGGKGDAGVRGLERGDPGGRLVEGGEDALVAGPAVAAEDEGAREDRERREAPAPAPARSHPRRGEVEAARDGGARAVEGGDVGHAGPAVGVLRDVDAARNVDGLAHR